MVSDLEQEIVMIFNSHRISFTIRAYVMKFYKNIDCGLEKVKGTITLSLVISEEKATTI